MKVQKVKAIQILGVVVIAVVAVIAANQPAAQEQSAGDLTQNEDTGYETDSETPRGEFEHPEKTIELRVNFLDRFNVDVEEIEIRPTRTHGSPGAPALLKIKLYDINGEFLKQYNKWHPLWIEVEGMESIILESDIVNVKFPFRLDVAQIRIEDGAARQEIIDIDVVPAIHEYCLVNPEDAECDEVVNRSPTCDAGGPYIVECAGDTTNVTLNGSQSADPDLDSLQFLWSGVFGTASGATPNVAFENVGALSVSLAVNDGFGETEMCDTTVTIQDTTPPSITAVSASPNQLWPPNNKMVPVTVEVDAIDSCIDTPTCEITSVSSNEAANGKEPDWEITGDLTLNLRAERSGGGSGRSYTINVQCTDNDENKATSTATVAVSHDQGKKKK